MLRKLFKLFQRPHAQARSPIEALEPDVALVQYKLGNQLRDRGELEAALTAYDSAIARNPMYANALCNRGVVLQRLNRPDEALESLDRAIELNPNDFLAYYNRASVLLELKCRNEALASYNGALAIKPDYLEAYCNRGNLLTELDRPEEALASYDRAIEINPHFHHAYLARGVLSFKRRQWERAFADFARAIEIAPDYAEAYSGQGSVLRAQRRYDAALEKFSRAIDLKPDLAEAHCGRGVALTELNRHDEAMVSFDTAVAVDPKFVDALQCRGDAHYAMRRYEGALLNYNLALALRPDGNFLQGMRLFLKMHLCDWRNFEPDLRSLAEGIEAGKRMTPPFQLLSLMDSASLHHRAAETWALTEYPIGPVRDAIPKRSARAKIRIGYFSADFKEHPVAMLLAQILELHDREKYEIIAFSFGVNTRDAMRKRMESACDRFIDVYGQSDEEIAHLARSLEVDIAIDLMGYTTSSRTGIFAFRAAPLQVNYLGYPGTLGARFMDYLIGDRVIVPESNQAYFTEKIVYLPNSYLPNDSTRHVSLEAFTREALGLPPTGFVFCCFNGNYKIAPHTFDSWMRVLRRVPDGVLWLSGSHPSAVNNLRDEALRQGVDPSRLIFASRMPSPADHLARHRAADLFLDTLPYNAHSTAMDALWAGLPVLTLIGTAFAGRVGASLLKAVGLPELMVSTTAEYEDLAVQLATDPPRLAEFRRRLAKNRSSAPLFDTDALTRHLEAGYAEMMQRYWAGLPPDHIYISGDQAVEGGLVANAQGV